MRCQVLRLIHNQPCFGKGSSPGKGECSNFNTMLTQYGCEILRLFAQQEREIIGNRTHPGLHLLPLSSRKKADILPHRYGCTRHQNFIIAADIQCLMQSAGKC